MDVKGFVVTYTGTLLGVIVLNQGLEGDLAYWEFYHYQQIARKSFDPTLKVPYCDYGVFRQQVISACEHAHPAVMVVEAPLVDK